MLKDIKLELEKEYNEKFIIDDLGIKVEFWSENHLYIYNRRTNKLIKNY